MTFNYAALPSRVVFGDGASAKLAEEVARLGAERVLVIASESTKGLAEQLSEPLGVRLAGVHTDVAAHVPIEVAEAARLVARHARPAVRRPPRPRPGGNLKAGARTRHDGPPSASCQDEDRLACTAYLAGDT